MPHGYPRGSPDVDDVEMMNHVQDDERIRQQMMRRMKMLSGGLEMRCQILLTLDSLFTLFLDDYNSG